MNAHLASSRVNGQIVSYIAVQRNITTRRAAEESPAFLAKIVEDPEDSIIACTSAGKSSPSILVRKQLGYANSASD